jgi:hypothetical protein
MTTRVTNRTVVFVRPFVLDQTQDAMAPGTYTIETEEELLDTVSFAAYRRVSTVMRYTEAGITSFIAVDPIALDAALMRDARSD